MKPLWKGKETFLKTVIAVCLGMLFFLPMLLILIMGPPMNAEKAFPTGLGADDGSKDISEASLSVGDKSEANLRSEMAYVPIVSDKEKWINETLENLGEGFGFFKISCGDGKERTYYFRSGMTFEIWAESEFNTDGWAESDGLLVKEIGNAGIPEYIKLQYGLLTQIEKGTVYKTERLFSAVYSDGEEDPAFYSVSRLNDFIAEISAGIEESTNRISAWYFIDVNKKLPCHIVFSYENMEVTDITSTYYCERPVAAALLRYLQEYEEFETVSEFGRSFVCKKSAADCRWYTSLGRENVLEYLKNRLDAYCQVE